MFGLTGFWFTLLSKILLFTIYVQLVFENTKELHENNVLRSVYSHYIQRSYNLVNKIKVRRKQ